MVHLVGRRVRSCPTGSGMADGVSVTAAQWVARAAPAGHAGAHGRRGRPTRRAGPRSGDRLPAPAVAARARPRARRRRPRRRRQHLLAADEPARSARRWRTTCAAGPRCCATTTCRGSARSTPTSRLAARRPAWWHVTINELARRALAGRRGIAATTIYHGFAERPCPRRRARSAAGSGVARRAAGPAADPGHRAQGHRRRARPHRGARRHLLAHRPGRGRLPAPSSTRSWPRPACRCARGCRSACGWPARTPRATSWRCRRRGRASGCR